MAREDTEVSVEQSRSSDCCKRREYAPFCRIFMVRLAVISTFFLLAGSFSGGWLRISANLKVDDDVAYYHSKYGAVYQDYGIWGVTQCRRDDEGYSCDTRSYLLLRGLTSTYPYYKPDIPDFVGNSNFDNIRLAFSYRTIWFLQAAYTMGTLASIFNLCMALKLRKKSQQSVIKAMKRQNLITFNLVPAILVMIPVIVFGIENEKISSEGISQFPFGLVFGALGGSVLLIASGFMLLHTRICGPVAQTLPLAPEEIGNRGNILINSEAGRSYT